MRTKPLNFDHIPDLEFARLAAWIDSEGCFAMIKQPSKKTQRHSDSWNIRLSIVQADKRPIKWAQRTFGGSCNKGTGGTNAPMWYWLCHAANMEAIITRCLPFFLVKREQALLILEYRRTLTLGRRRLTPEVVLQREVIRQRLGMLKRPWKDEKKTSEVVSPPPTIH